MKVKLALIIVVAVTFTAISTSFVSAQQDAQAAERYSVLGAVSKPGNYEYKPSTTVKTAVNNAGGLSSIADKKSCILTRGQEKIAVELEGILTGTKPDVPMQGGDSITIKPGTFRVEGKVKKPGDYELKENLRAAQAVEIAGGLSEEASGETVYVERDSNAFMVKLAAAPGSADEGSVLQPGDVVVVSGLSVAVTGEVKNPGMYTLLPGQSDKLSDAIRAAGGPTDKANMKKVQVTVADGEKSKAQVVDATSPSGSSMVLHKGDTVYVPGPAEKKHTDLNDVYTAIALILLVASAL